MSDDGMDEDDFMNEDEDEDFDFEYEDEDIEEEEGDVGLENKYYNAKGFLILKPLS